MSERRPSILEEPPGPIGGKSYVHGQILEWILDKKVLRFADMTNLPRNLRDSLDRDYDLNSLEVLDARRDSDGARKFLFALRRSEPVVRVESVFIPSHTHATACLSTQAGCAVGCVFCATGAAGAGRNLHWTEIVLQLLNMESCLSDRVASEPPWDNRPSASAHPESAIRNPQSAIPLRSAFRVSHVVLMGMGEPLLNYDEVVRAIRFFEESRLRVSARRITLSTVGIADRIRQLADDGVRVELALSLHSAIEEKRRRLVPYAALPPLAEIMDACDHWFRKTRRLPTIEYVLVRGENDGTADVRALERLLRDRPWKVNLIALNGPVRGYQSPPREGVAAFRQALEKAGIRVTVRRSVGRNIQAACGQLAGGKGERSP